MSCGRMVPMATNFYPTARLPWDLSDVGPPKAEDPADHDFDDETPTPIVRTLTIEEQHALWLEEQKLADELGIATSERTTRPIKKLPKP